MLQSLICMDACISNNFIFIFSIIVKNNRKVIKAWDRGCREHQKVYLSEIAICVMEIASEQYGHKGYPQQQHLFAKCEHGLKYNFRIVWIKMLKKYKWIFTFCKNHNFKTITRLALYWTAPRTRRQHSNCLFKGLQFLYETL